MTEKVLFLCDEHRLRSPTGARVFEDRAGVETRSAGVRHTATVPVTREMLEWADLVLVMERPQRNLVHKRFPDVYENTRIVCLYIPDDYDYMDPELVDLLRERVEPLLDPKGGP